jgi:hypothetical protein
MISLQDELLTPKQAASLLPLIEGKAIDQSAIWRWARQGLQGVKLEHIRLGGRILTTMEALERFTKELAEVDLPSAVNNEKEDS